MSFIRRLLSGSQPRPMWEIPDSGYMEVAGVYHHLDELGTVFGRSEEKWTADMSVTLVRDPHNQYDPNAVEVRLRGALAGYLPAETAAAWAGRLDEAEAAGLVTTATAHVWYRWTRDQKMPSAYVHIRISEHP